MSHLNVGFGCRDARVAYEQKRSPDAELALALAESNLQAAQDERARTLLGSIAGPDENSMPAPMLEEQSGSPDRALVHSAESEAEKVDADRKHEVVVIDDDVEPAQKFRRLETPIGPIDSVAKVRCEVDDVSEIVAAERLLPISLIRKHVSAKDSEPGSSLYELVGVVKHRGQVRTFCS